MNSLKIIDKDLSDRFARLEPDAASQVVANTAGYCRRQFLASSEDVQPAVDLILDVTHGRIVPSDLEAHATECSKRAAQYDDAYLAAEAQGIAENEWYPLFLKARFMSAVANAVVGDFDEAMYELASMSPSPEHVLRWALRESGDPA